MSHRFAGLSPKVLRMLVTVCAMTATIMQALDTTIANVALPYMQGSLSASLDQINWVLTSYIVAAAIMTAPIGWLADRFGRKKLFVTCVAGFTVASLLCALAQNIEQIVLFRLLQGMAGAALVPLSQSTLLDAYTIEERGSAMAVWGIGVNVNTLPLVTVGVGFGIDYGLYIMSRIIEEIRVNGDLDLSIREALVTSGKAVSFTAVCMVASTALWGFSNIRFDAIMGSLLAIWMFISFVASETLTPVLISYFRPSFIMREAARAKRRPQPAATAAAAS